MRQLSAIEMSRIKLLTEKSVELCLIEPTKTALEKHIIDATGSVRAYLKTKEIHDYEFQKQGASENGIQVETNLVSENTILKTSTSLYRPKAKGKGGDPRIWISKLPNFAKANDILGIFAFENQLYILNITQLNLHKLIESEITNPLMELVNEINHLSTEISDELLIKLRAIASQGFVSALLQADTAIGRTLEFLLGIPMNSSKNPDYKGIELKSARENKGTRKGLFGKIPNWKLSKFKSRIEILNAFGYWEDGIFRLYNTIRATGRNAQGLILRTDYDLDYLFENSDRKEIGDFLVWELQVLKNALAIKHKETFWIKAESKFEDNKEYFLYKSAEHTRSPMLNQFGLLIDMGIITVDYNIKRLPNGSVDDAGCNFKLKPNALGLLFPPSQSYSLI